VQPPRHPSVEALDRCRDAGEIGVAQRVLVETFYHGPEALRKRESTNVTVFVRLAAQVAQQADQFAVAVIGGVRADEAALPRDEASHLNGDFVCLGAAAAEHHTFDPVMIEPGQSLGERHDTFMKISAVHVDGGLLLRHGLHDRRIGVSHARHIVVHVDVAPSVCVV
jgi:hypothetical protein